MPARERIQMQLHEVVVHVDARIRLGGRRLQLEQRVDELTLLCGGQVLDVLANVDRGLSLVLGLAAAGRHGHEYDYRQPPERRSHGPPYGLERISMPARTSGLRAFPYASSRGV